ncbi:MAG: STAS domain-containing protein [Alphaproteobacteria bacterium]
MINTKISMSVRFPKAGISIIDIQGDFTGTSEEVLMAAYEEASKNGTKSIVLNFTGLDYMNSSGIGLLVTMLIRVQRQKQNLLAYGLSEHYQQIFDLTRLNEAIGIYENEEAATSAAK